MAERRPRVDVRGTRGISKTANRSTRLEQEDDRSRCKVLVQNAQQAEHEAGDNKVGDARRSYVEGYWHPSMSDRKCCEAWRPLLTVVWPLLAAC
jgi:hypothetical protein